jgi:hypothetical protein
MGPDAGRSSGPLHRRSPAGPVSDLRLSRLAPDKEEYVIEDQESGCRGCAARAKLRRALACVEPTTPVQPIIEALFDELTLGELWHCAAETLADWAAEERRPAGPIRAPRKGQAQ